MSWLDSLKFNADGLLPVVAQEAATGDVLMVAFANREALERTVDSGFAHYWSRSRSEIWRKGETSGHTQQVRQILVDCDGDALIYRVRQEGPACHTGEATCFFREVGDGALTPATPARHILARVDGVIARRAEERPEGSYTTYLLEKGLDKVLKKLGEETTEVVVAAKNSSPQELRAEVSDLLFHLLVLLRVQGLPLEEVWSELEARFGAAPRLPGPRASNHPSS